MKIKCLREMAGLDQITLGVRMGVAQSTISEWEREVSLPRARLLPQLASVLGVTIDELYEPYQENYTRGKGG